MTEPTIPCPKFPGMSPIPFERCSQTRSRTPRTPETMPLLPLTAFFLLTLGLMTLVGCTVSGSTDGGGTTTGPVTQGSPQGVYTGTTSTGETFETIVLPNSTFYALYGTTSGNVFTVDGMITGQGVYNNGKYTATVTDYYYTGVAYTGTVSATYAVGSSLSGTVLEAGHASVIFSGVPIPSSQFTFGTPALLSNITGTWSGALFGNAASQVAIAANGTFTGSSQGCAFSGTITPDSSGSNFFDFTIRYGGSPCLLPNQTQTGVAVDYLLSDGVTRQLLAGVSSASLGNVFIANRAGTPPPANPSFVQSSNFTSQSTVSNPASTYTATFNRPVAKGDLVAVAFWWNLAPGSSIVSVTDSAGNAYYPVKQTSSVDSNDWAGWIYAATNVTGAINLSVTVKVSSANASQFSMAILEYSNVGTPDVTSTAGGTSGVTVSSGSVATHHANELILGIAVADVNVTAGSGFNSRFVSPYFCVEEKIVTTQGNYDANFVTSNTIQYEGWDAAMATFY
jgi:hypothetical protein